MIATDQGEMGKRQKAPAPRGSFRFGCSEGDFPAIDLIFRNSMDQKYVETVRACKVLLSNLDHLEGNTTSGQRSELERLLWRVVEQVHQFLDADAQDPGLWVGEE